MTDSRVTEFTYDAVLDSLNKAAEEFNQQTAEHVEELPIELAAQYLVELRAIVKALRDADAYFERWIAQIFKDQGWRTGYQNGHPVEGVGDVEVTRSKTTTWASEALLKAWLEAYLGEHEGDTEPWALTHELARALGVITASGAGATSAPWRITPLKALGIDPDEFSDKEWGAPHVRIIESRSGD